MKNNYELNYFKIKLSLIIFSVSCLKIDYYLSLVFLLYLKIMKDLILFIFFSYYFESHCIICNLTN